MSPFLTMLNISFTQSSFSMSLIMKSKQCVTQRFPHIVWVFNNSHHAHKLVIGYIVNNNLYDIDKVYIFYDLFNVTMDMSSYKVQYFFILLNFNNMFQFQTPLPSHFAFQHTKRIKDNKSKL
jgi:hypothetical protein